MNRKASLLSFAIAALVSLGAANASAQSEGDASSDRPGTSTVVLKFENMQVSEDVMTSFYRTLNERINQQDDMHVVDGGEVTIQELIVTVGCEKPDPDCLAGLTDYVDADRMVFGSVQRSGDAYLFSIKMFDFAEERFLRRVSEQSVQGNETTVKEAIPAVVESFLHGDTGTLKVSTTGSAEGTRVYFDGEKLGIAPTTLENLPLGQHAITIRTNAGEEKTKFVILRHGRTQSIEFDAGTQKTKPKARKKGSPALGYAVAGLGLAGVVVGAYGQVQNAKFRSDSNELRCQGGDAVCPPPGSGLTTQEAAARADDLRQKVPQTAYLSAAGYSVGAIGLGIGGYLLYRHYSSSPEGSRSKTALRSVRLQPRREGMSLGLSLDF